MSHDAFNRNGTGPTPLPGWARGGEQDFQTRANEPLVVTVDLTNTKKDVKKDLKEIQRAVDDIAKLSRKKGGDHRQQVHSLLEQVRRRARGTAAKIRDALGQTDQGSADYGIFSKLSEQLKETLKEFQKYVEVAQASESAASSSTQPLAIVEIERGGRGNGHEPQGQMQMQQQETAATQDMVHAMQTNDMFIADREVGIENIHRSVQELHEIFQDINALVAEQGDHIDNIQTNIEKASNHQARAVTELVSASRHQRRGRRAMCWVVIMVVVLMIILLIMLKIYGGGMIR
uniref:t-SNARE coiled-coil homology domain-containing protein n=1 Tax=Haptolina ericina TaxID=156174 RepID=A0A7S3FA61_9EUKA